MKHRFPLVIICSSLLLLLACGDDDVSSRAGLLEACVAGECDEGLSCECGVCTTGCTPGSCGAGLCVAGTTLGCPGEDLCTLACGDCPAGFECVAGACARPIADGGGSDAGSADTGGSDAGGDVDGGSDGGSSDAGIACSAEPVAARIGTTQDDLVWAEVAPGGCYGECPEDPADPNYPRQAEFTLDAPAHLTWGFLPSDSSQWLMSLAGCDGTCLGSVLAREQVGTQRLDPGTYALQACDHRMRYFVRFEEIPEPAANTTCEDAIEVGSRASTSRLTTAAPLYFTFVADVPDPDLPEWYVYLRDDFTPSGELQVSVRSGCDESTEVATATWSAGRRAGYQVVADWEATDATRYWIVVTPSTSGMRFSLAVDDDPAAF